MSRAIKFQFALVCLLLGTLAVAKQEESNKDDDEELLDDELRATRRVEISRALALLKKHAIVGRGAKIVLKSRGKHLLVDPSDRLKVVPEVGDTSSSSIARQTLASSSGGGGGGELKKSAKKEEKTTRKSKKKRTTGSATTFATKDFSSKQSSMVKLKLRPGEVGRVSELLRMQRDMLVAASNITPTVVESLMGKALLDEVTKTLDSIVRNRRAETLSQLADLISEALDEHFGAHWHTVVVGSDQLSTSKDKMKDHDRLTTRLDLSGQMVAIDDHHRRATFFATFDFGEQLRVFIFK